MSKSSRPLTLLERARRMRVSLALSVLAVVVHVVPGLATLFEYDTAAVLHGQAWRLWTGHLAHGSLEHLAWDVLAFAILGGWLEARHPRVYWRCLAASALIPVAVALADPSITHYRGLSGIDSALYVVVALLIGREALTRRHRPLAALAGLALLTFIAKIGWEYFSGNTVFVDSTIGNMVAVPVAHLAGAVLGSMAVLTPQRNQRRQQLATACAPPDGPLPCAPGNVPDVGD